MQGSLVALTLSSWYDFDLRLRRCGFVDPQALDLLKPGLGGTHENKHVDTCYFFDGFERGIQSIPESSTYPHLLDQALHDVDLVPTKRLHPKVKELRDPRQS